MSFPWRKLAKSIQITCDKYDDVFVMVSGGVDSMFLADFIQRNTDVNPSIIHFRHGIRDDDDIEMKLVKKFSQKHNLPFHCGLGKDLKDCKNQEAVARQQRWDFVESLCDQNKRNLVITAHHLDDQIESVFMGLVRGKSLKALAMRPVVSFPTHDRYKPLLDIPKDLIYKQCESRKIDSIEDPTNQELDHERNIWRNVIIPHIENIRNVKKSMRGVITELSSLGVNHESSN